MDMKLKGTGVHAFAVSDMPSPFARAQTLVIWDVNDCPLPDKTRPAQVFRIIQKVLGDNGYHGPVSVTPHVRYENLGDYVKFNGIRCLLHVAKDRDERYKDFLFELFTLAMGAAPGKPLNLMLILGDDISDRKDFFRVFRLLQSRLRFRILLAMQPQDLSYEGIWNALSDGESVMRIKCGTRPTYVW